MNHQAVETEGSLSSVLELAANNDVDGFKRCVDRDPLAIDEVGDWYGRKKVVEERTPLMVAATYGSIDVLKLILKLSTASVNRCCGPDKTTALHCAASGGSANAVQSVKILLLAGADPNCLDAHGHRPGDLITVPPKLSDAKSVLEVILGCSCLTGMENPGGSLRVSTSAFNSNSLLLSSSVEEDTSSFSDYISPLDGKFQNLPQTVVHEKKDYPVDPSLPDIKNCFYATDEFRMYSFKVLPCSRAYSHDWTECPFVHPGENARRRDPRKHHYSCSPCPDFRKGPCRRGDACEYAHGVFECWLHPAQYRTKLCKDGISCSRRVCFFAHTTEELRPLYVPTGSAMPSPRSSPSPAMELAAMGLMPSSPASVSAAMPMSFTHPMSPSANGISHSPINWQQSNVPFLHVTRSNLQSSRLRSSLSARNMPVDEYSMMQEFETQQLVNDLCISRSIPSSGLQKAHSPSDLFSSNILSPRFNCEQTDLLPSHMNSVNHFQQQQQSIQSPVNTGLYTQKVVDQQLPMYSSFLQTSLDLPSPGRIPPRNVEPISPQKSRLSAFCERENQLQQTLSNLGFHDHGAGGTMISAGSPVGSSLPKWGSASGTLDWCVNNEELGRLKQSSLELSSGDEEPDLSWVHSLVKEESSPEKPAATRTLVGLSNMAPAVASADCSSAQIDSTDHASALVARLEEMQLDQKVV